MAKKTEPAELTLESLAAEVKNQNKKIAQLEETNKALSEELKKKAVAPAASVEVKKAEKVIKPEGTVKHNGKEYQFTMPKVRGLKGQIINTVAIVESPELYEAEIAHYAAKAPGVLKEKE